MPGYLYFSEQMKTVFAYILYGLTWIAWLLLLGGLSAVQSSCDDLQDGTLSLVGVDVAGLSCTSVFSYMWWMLVFQVGGIMVWRDGMVWCDG